MARGCPLSFHLLAKLQDTCILSYLQRHNRDPKCRKHVENADTRVLVSKILRERSMNLCTGSTGIMIVNSEEMFGHRLFFVDRIRISVCAQVQYRISRVPDAYFIGCLGSYSYLGSY